ncbi:Homeobox protein HOX1A [Hordeum vulgare]|nr:Homeobox protein HOX1A [Hordeum vulgare]
MGTRTGTARAALNMFDGMTEQDRELENVEAFGEIELEKERLQLTRDAEDVKIMLTDETFLDEQVKKWLAEKKETNNRRVLGMGGRLRHWSRRP